MEILDRFFTWGGSIMGILTGIIYLIDRHSKREDR